MEIKGISSNIGTPGPLRVCPICSEPLSNAEMGVNAHLRKHIREGRLAEDDLHRVKLEVLKRTFKG